MPVARSAESQRRVPTYALGMGAAAGQKPVAAPRPVSLLEVLWQ